MFNVGRNKYRPITVIEYRWQATYIRYILSRAESKETEAMNTLLNESNYGKLLKKTLPLVIHTDAEHQRLLLAASDLMDKPEAEMSVEDGHVLEVLSVLIEEYEDRVHPLPKTEPHKMLNHLLQEKGLRPAGLAGILPKSRVSEILNGKRGISKTRMKRLAARLRVPVELFL